jgi:hypothetical protein
VPKKRLNCSTISPISAPNGNNHAQAGRLQFDARIAELEAENEELKKAISKPWMGSARAAYLGEKE